VVSGRLPTAADVRRLLAKHGLAPRKARGQHFVIDPNTIRKVVREADLAPSDLVCEVGAGLGSLTLGLRAAGAHVVAVEIDAGLVSALTELVGDDPGVQIVEGDALRLDHGDLVGGGPAALVANLPYHVATPIVFRALEAAVFDRLVVMVQREVGERWAATVESPRYGAVSVKLAAQADVTLRGRISRSAFYPVPNVDSVLVRLDPKPWSAPVPRQQLFAYIEQGFAQRRKRLRNALASERHRPAAVEAALATVGLDAGARAEELDLPAWIALTQALDPPPSPG
jgi:16S rRNA (adenine1518-N6/adenine1519-N6)-dimethyltransferase